MTPIGRRGAWPICHCGGMAEAWRWALPWRHYCCAAPFARSFTQFERLPNPPLPLAKAIFDQLVSVSSHDEIGQLANAFNAMARQLRDLLQSQQGQLVLAQQTGQA